MLTEKYRPTKFDDIVGQKRIKEVLQSHIANGTIPNCIFIGKPGTGKTAMAYIVKWAMGISTRDGFMELNAADERSINTIRVKVKGFARTSKLTTMLFKLCLLDEIDGMPKRPAQQALRRLMEQYTDNVRFILTANESSRVSQALISRCETFRFRALTNNQMLVVLNRILTKEEAEMPSAVRMRIAELSEGDARGAINTLSAMLNLDNPTPEDVEQFVGKVSDENIYHLLHVAKKGEYRALGIVKDLTNAGGSANQIMRQAWYSMLSPRVRGFSDSQRTKILIHLGSLPGASDEMRLAAFVARMIDDKTLR